MDIITFFAFYLNPFLQHNNQPKTKNAKRTIHMIEPLAKEFEEYKEKLLQWKAKNGFVHSEDGFVFPSKINTGLGSKTFYRHYQ